MLRGVVLIELLVGLVIPLGLDLYMPVPEDNPLTAERIERGRRLFFDPRLSRDGSMSCATCHEPDRGFADTRPVAVGVGGRYGRRNAPALINRGYGRAFFWDGRTKSLEDQVVKPIDDANELGSSLAEASTRLGIPAAEIAPALASFVRSILSGNSRFDRFINGDRTVLDAGELRRLPRRSQFQRRARPQHRGRLARGCLRRCRRRARGLQNADPARRRTDRSVHARRQPDDA
jgi:cytochrome c peroxidase